MTAIQSERTDDTSANDLLHKVRAFVDSLPPSQRELFAVLIGPGVETLMQQRRSTKSPGWQPRSLRTELAGAVAASQWRIAERN